MIELVPGAEELRPRIVVIGVGGAGGNAVANMIRNNVVGVEFVVANTDSQALQTSSADQLVQLGRSTTQGLGAGSRAELGRAAAEESLAEIEQLLAGTNMCFIAAGMGGGTGTGAAPIIARTARKLGILTVGVVTKPFGFEGGRRERAAEQGIEELQQHVDSLIVIPNQNLFRVASPSTTFRQAFALADDVLQQGVQGITDLMVMPGLINLDFADVRTVMADMGRAMMGTGEAGGEGRALRAAEAAIANPLLDESLGGARGLLVSICGGSDMRLMEVDEAATHIRNLVDAEADIIWGSAFNPELEGRIRVSIVATGIEAGRVTAQAIETQGMVAVPAAPPPAALATAHNVVPEPVRDAACVTPMLRAVPLPGPQLPAVVASIALSSSGVREEAETVSPAAVVVDLPELLLEPERMFEPVGIGRLDEPLFQPQAEPTPMRGPSLFERMAMAARGAVIAQRGRGTAGPTAVRHGPVFLDRRRAA